MLAKRSLQLIHRFDIAGYSYEQKCRPCGTDGGIGAHIRNGTPYIRRFDLESENLECIWLEICFPHTKGLLIGIIYRPPNTSNYLQDNFNFLWGREFRNCSS